MNDALRPGSPDAADIAKLVNAHISEMASNLDAILPDERPIGFFCECGCMGITMVGLADYAAAGAAWLDGHEPVANIRACRTCKRSVNPQPAPARTRAQRREQPNASKGFIHRRGRTCGAFWHFRSSLW